MIKKAFFVHSNFTDVHCNFTDSKFITAPCPSEQYMPVIIKIVRKELWTAIT